MIIINLVSFSPLEFLVRLLFSLIFVQTLNFYNFPGNNMYVPGDCNILLICACDL